jgi:hypothetical protein
MMLSRAGEEIHSSMISSKNDMGCETYNCSPNTMLAHLPVFIFLSE